MNKVERDQHRRRAKHPRTRITQEPSMCYHDGKSGGCVSRPDRSCGNVKPSKPDTKWKAQVRAWLDLWEPGTEFTLPDIYDHGATMALKRKRKNRHIRAKIRQALQELCAEGDHILERVSRGVYRVPLPPGHPSRHAKPAAPPLREALVRAAIEHCVTEVLAINNKS